MDEKLPRRIAWFAPWTWKRRWVWAIVAALMIGGYIEMPVILGLNQSGTLRFQSPSCMPHYWCFQNCPPIHYFYIWQVNGIEKVREYFD